MGGRRTTPPHSSTKACTRRPRRLRPRRRLAVREGPGAGAAAANGHGAGGDGLLGTPPPPPPSREQLLQRMPSQLGRLGSAARRARTSSPTRGAPTRPGGRGRPRASSASMGVGVSGRGHRERARACSWTYFRRMEESPSFSTYRLPACRVPGARRLGGSGLTGMAPEPQHDWLAKLFDFRAMPLDRDLDNSSSSSSNDDDEKSGSGEGKYREEGEGKGEVEDKDEDEKGLATYGDAALGKLVGWFATQAALEPTPVDASCCARSGRSSA